jgi:hypothetical protein
VTGPKQKLVHALLLPAILFLASDIRAMTITLPGGGAEFVKPGDTWRFFRGKAAPSAPLTAWKEVDFVDSSWEQGPGGFGYKYTANIGTTLGDMLDTYLTVYIRKEFTVAGPLDASAVQLEVDYDDGFVAYLNGALVAWRNMSKDPSTETIDQNTARFYNRVAFDLDYGGMANTTEEGDRIAALMGNKQIMMLGNHGILVCASTVAEAFDLTYYLERACRNLVMAYQTGRKLHVMTPAVAEKTAQEWEADREQFLAHFEEMKRILDSQDPSYAD